MSRSRSDLAPPAGKQSPGSPAPTSRAARLLAASVASALLVVATGCGVVTDVTGLSERRVTQQVERLLTAVRDGRASEAFAMLERGPGADLLVPDAAYAAATDRITGWTVGDVIAGPELSTVSVTLHRGDARRPIHLILDEETQLFRGYGLTHVGLLQGSTRQQTTQVNGVDLPPHSGSPGATVQVLAFPGRYEVRTEAGPLLQSTPVVTPVTLEGWDGPAGGPFLEPSAEGRRELTSIVQDHLRECLAQSVAEPEGCPNQAPLAEGAERIEWTMEEEPSSGVSEGSVLPLGGLLQLDGIFTVTWTDEDGDRQDHRSRGTQVPFTIDVVDEDLRVEFDPG